MGESSLSAKIDDLGHRAEADLAEAAGDLSLCAVAKSGRAMPALKYHEGRAAMTADLKRGCVDDHIAPAALEAIRLRWDRMSGLGLRSRDWEAYLQGGSDILAELGIGSTGR